MPKGWKDIAVSSKLHRTLSELKREFKAKSFHAVVEKLVSMYVSQDLATTPRAQQKTSSPPYEPECEFGTPLKAENKIHCKCTYPSIKKWLPRNRKVDPEVCQRCYPKIQRIQEWIAEKKEQGMPTRPESLAEPALCHLKQQWFRDYGDFPCWKDLNLNCPNTKCPIQPRR